MRALVSFQISSSKSLMKIPESILKFDRIPLNIAGNRRDKMFASVSSRICVLICGLFLFLKVST